ncbi:MAG: anti-sigma factor family protein [Planctomycetota bacterium]
MKNIVLILTMRCDQASQLMSRAQEKPLSRPERWALSFHLLICRLCRKYNRQLRFLRAVLTRMVDPQTYDAVAPPLLDPEQIRAFQDRLLEKIRESLDSM